MTKASVLYIDDDTALITVVGHYLEDEGYTVHTAQSSAAVDTALQNLKPDVVILDLGLPDADGFSVLGRIKNACDAGVIIASGKSETTEKIVGLEMGADDYLTKPYELRELAARIKAVLRRRAAPAPSATPAAAAIEDKHAQSGPVRLMFEGMCLDRNQYQVFDAHGTSLDLTTGEFKLLEALVLSPNRVLTRDHLFDLTRDGNFESFDRAIDIQIGRIRKKLGDSPRTPRMIKTVRGVGYMCCLTPAEEVA